MKDKSLLTNNQPNEISERLQRFIDSMVEEIVIEGKPFDTQKKYLQKYSENEGIDYNKLESDVTTFIEILNSLKTASGNLLVKLAEEKGQACYISQGMVEKLIKHSVQTHASVTTPSNSVKSTKKYSRKWLWAMPFCLLAIAIPFICYLNDRVVVSKATGVIEEHGWVDLGLPSGLKWATCNMGSLNPSDFGEQYAWGEIATKSESSWMSYRFRSEGDSNKNVKFIKYNTDSDHGFVDNKMQLDFDDDVAHASWGGEWRIPTAEDINELLENCTFKWGKLDGIRGCKATSRINGNSVFFPALNSKAGWERNLGSYWSSTLSSSSSLDAYVFAFIHSKSHIVEVRPEEHKLYVSERFYLSYIRPVMDHRLSSKVPSKQNSEGDIKPEIDKAHNVTKDDRKAKARNESVKEEAISYQLVEKKPTFNGGDANEFSKWVNAKLVYPEDAKENGVQGRVVLEFLVDTDGSVSDVKVVHGADESLNKEAVRVVSSSPKWKPGMQNDRAVRVVYTFPVVFQLN